MSVVIAREITDGRRAEQDFGGVAKTSRAFTVTIDDPATPLSEIADACGIQWLDPHPEFPIYCTSIRPEEDGSPLHYKVTFSYDLVKEEDRFILPWERLDKFSYDGSITSAPCFVHFPNGSSNPALIVNSAGDPLEGLSRDEAEWTVSIEGNRRLFIKSVARAYLNAVNSDWYSDCAPGTVKCQRISGSNEIENIQGEDVSYWKVSITLAYREVGWEIRTWDIGFNEIVSGQRRRILDGANQPIAAPVALSGGAKKPAGSAPDMLTFYPYKQLPFSGIFPVLP